MATRFLHKGPTADGTGNAHGFSADDNNVLVHHNGSTAGLVAGRRVVSLTGAYTATEADNGTLFIANALVSPILTLPSTRAGLEYYLTIGTLPTSGTGVAASPAAADQIIGNGFTPADNKDAVCVVASDRLGDTIRLTGDGSAGWYITAVSGTWTREA